MKYVKPEKNVSHRQGTVQTRTVGNIQEGRKPTLLHLAHREREM